MEMEMGFIMGVVCTALIMAVFLGSCDEIHFMRPLQQGIEYDNKIVRVVVDSARTDSLHDWRKNNGR